LLASDKIVLQAARWAADSRCAALHAHIAPNGESAAEVCTAAGLAVKQAALGHVAGLYFESQRAIVLNETLGPRARAFTLWHELGHHLHAHGYAPQADGDPEGFCDGLACVASDVGPCELAFGVHALD
jgi:Zn-dependent peptidase ImmA (M78 family)